MSEISRALADEVIRRANGRCEYCQLSQAGQEATFHIDHVTPRAADGSTKIENLALACVSCSLRKWAKQTAIDPLNGAEVRLFNPRLDIWADHFRWDSAILLPMTPIARATIESLSMNRPLIVGIRLEEIMRGRHPPR